MTKEELKNLVATKISGQGNQVDLGNALTTILNELIDEKEIWLTFDNLDTESEMNLSLEDIPYKFGMSGKGTDFLIDMMKGKIQGIIIPDNARLPFMGGRYNENGFCYFIFGFPNQLNAGQMVSISGYMNRSDWDFQYSEI